MTKPSLPGGCIWCQGGTGGYHLRCANEAIKLGDLAPTGPLPVGVLAAQMGCSRRTVGALVSLALRKLQIVHRLGGRICRSCNARGWVGARQVRRACVPCRGSGYFRPDGAPGEMIALRSARDLLAAWRRKSPLPSLENGVPEVAGAHQST